MATLKFAKVVYDIKLTSSKNLLLVLGRCLIPSRRRCSYKMAYKWPKNAKNGFFWVATLTTLATLKFSKVVYDIKLTLLNNPLLVLGQNILPSRRRCSYKFVKVAVTSYVRTCTFFHSNRYIYIYIYIYIIRTLVLLYVFPYERPFDKIIIITAPRRYTIST